MFKISGGTADLNDFDELADQLTVFIAGGMAAPKDNHHMVLADIVGPPQTSADKIATTKKAVIKTATTKTKKGRTP